MLGLMQCCAYSAGYELAKNALNNREKNANAALQEKYLSVEDGAS